MTDFIKFLKIEKYFINVEISSLSELDFLTELFSFFTEFDSSVSRQASKWWNDLLSKDSLTIKQLKRNNVNFGVEAIGKKDNKLNQSSQLGYLKLLEWSKNNGRELDNSLCSSAAVGGNLNVLIWLKFQGITWNYASYCFVLELVI
jgi:hypothetical protein